MREYFDIKTTDSLWSYFGRLIFKNRRASFAMLLMFLSTLMISTEVVCPSCVSYLRDNFLNSIYQKNLLYDIKSKLFYNNGKNQQSELAQELQFKLDKMHYQNQQLADLVNYVERNEDPTHKIITTKLLSNWEGNELFIKLGKENGIQSDHLVVNEKGLIGKVVSVYEGFSKIMLATHKDFKIPAVSAKTKSRFIAKGNGNGKLEIVLQHQMPSEGELILSAMNAEDIAIGYFDQKTMLIKPINDAYNVNYVIILLQ